MQKLSTDGKLDPNADGHTERIPKKESATKIEIDGELAGNKAGAFKDNVPPANSGRK